MFVKLAISRFVLRGGKSTHFIADEMKMKNWFVRMCYTLPQPLNTGRCLANSEILLVRFLNLWWSPGHEVHKPEATFNNI